MEVKRVRSSHTDSYERICHDAGVSRFLLYMRRDDALPRRLAEQRLERFIGVIYRPETELISHYADASLPGCDGRALSRTSAPAHVEINRRFKPPRLTRTPQSTTADTECAPGG
jgi:hypothetical protein